MSSNSNLQTRTRHYAIRDAVPGDAKALGQVHVQVWQEAYRGVMPAAYLDKLSAESRAAFWEDLMATPDPNRLLLVLAAENGEVGGFLTAGTPRDLPPGGASSFRGEIHALNILQAIQGRGYGRRLMAHAADWLASRRMAPFFLWVLAENDRARDFYEELGGFAVAQRPITIGGKRLAEIAYQFADPAAVAARALGRR